MYYSHFGLKEPPFKITPNTEVFYTGGNRGAVLDALIYAINSGEGIVKVVGEVGSGKTMLCRMLQTMLPEKIESIYLANPSVAPEDVLHAIAFELQLKLPKNADRLKVMQVLQKHLLARHAAGKQVVIFVEEAQGMPLATLEEIRLLSNLETKHDKLLQIVLFGQPELDENLNQTNIRQLRERITHSFNLAPLQTKEIGEYLIFRLRAAGYFGPHLFSNSAISKIAASAEGLVRRVNILADKSLLAAFAENVYQVTPKHVQAAIADSEFGVEKAKQRSKQSQLLLWGVLLVLGLALGYAVSMWSQKHVVNQVQSQAAPEVAEKNVQSEAVKPSIETNTNQAKTAVVTTAPTSAAITPATPLSVATANAQEDILTQRLNATAAWLASRPPSTVSIQLMGAPSDEQLKNDLQILSQQLELDNIYVFRTKVNNLPFLTVLYGSFANRFEATQALKNLPAEIQKNRPQLRTIAGVLQETK
jgi:type II secretory pathway predicted ATPase ExeA